MFKLLLLLGVVAAAANAASVALLNKDGDDGALSNRNKVGGGELAGGGDAKEGGEDIKEELDQWKKKEMGKLKCLQVRVTSHYIFKNLIYILFF